MKHVPVSRKPATWKSRLARVVAVLGAAGASVAAFGQPVSAAGSSDFMGQTPQRLVDTRQGSSGRLQRGAVFELGFKTSDPVALNLTVVRPSFNGWLGAYPCSAGFSGTSNLNFNTIDGTVANFAIVQPDEKGKVCFTSDGPTAGSLDLLVDRYGTFQGADYAMQTPQRLFDSRKSGGQIGAQQVKVLSGFEPNSTQVLNLTVEQPAGPGFLTVYPCSQAMPTASASNYKVGTTRAALTLATADASGKVCVFTRQQTSLVVDKFGQMKGDSVSLTRPKRLMDTREGLAGNRTRLFALTFPESAGRAVALTVTSVNSAGPGHITVFPCAAGKIEASILNYKGKPATPNLVVVTPDANRKVCFSSPVLTDLVVDHYGYLGAAQTVDPASGACVTLSLETINEVRGAWGGPLAEFPGRAVRDAQCANLSFVVNKNGGVYRNQPAQGRFSAFHAVQRGRCDEARVQRSLNAQFVYPFDVPGAVITKPTMKFGHMSCMEYQAPDGTVFAHAEIWVSPIANPI